MPTGVLEGPEVDGLGLSGHKKKAGGHLEEEKMFPGL